MDNQDSDSSAPKLTDSTAQSSPEVESQVMKT